MFNLKNKMTKNLENDNAITGEDFDQETSDDTEFDEQSHAISFINETIKQKPVNRKKLFHRTIITAFSALIFGAIACFTFLILEPVISNLLYPEEIAKVSFPEEENETLPEELLTEEILKEEMEADFLQQVEQMTEKEEKVELTLEDYSNMYDQLYNVAYNTGKSLVTVKGAVSQVDFLQETIEKADEVSGVIIADNGVEYLILADISKLSEAKEYSVTFWTGKKEEAQLKASYDSTSLGIFSVRHVGFMESDIITIQVATLGNSKSGSLVGRPIIALGSPTGEKDSVAYGFVTSNSKTLSVVDGIYTLFDTDICGNKNSSGILINTNGEVIALLTEDSMAYGNNQLLVGVGVSELKVIVEKLSNGEQLAYSGVRGMDVTREAHDELAVPYGAYVAEVELQSPAMEMGILNGDIITQIDNTVINSFNDFRLAVLLKKPDDVVKMYIKRLSGLEYINMEVDVTLGYAK